MLCTLFYSRKALPYTCPDISLHLLEMTELGRGVELVKLSPLSDFEKTANPQTVRMLEV